MAIPTFTLTAGEGLHQLVGVTSTALAGAVLKFTCNLTPGELLALEGGLDIIDSVQVTLDAAGKINGDTGIVLLADDPVLDLAHPLQWRVEVSKAKINGFPKPVTAWSFFAGSAGDTLLLAEVAHVPGQTATGLGRGLRGYRSRAVPVDPGDPETLFQWEDETGAPFGEPTALSGAGLTALSVDGVSVTYYDLDTTPLTPGDIGAYTIAEVDAAIAASVSPNPQLASIKGTLGNTAMSIQDITGANAYIELQNAASPIWPGFYVRGTASNIGMILAAKGNYRIVNYADAGSVVYWVAGGANADVNADILSQGAGVVKANGVAVVTISGTQTLTNKTADLASNTLTGTTAQFNTALSDANFAVSDSNNNVTQDAFIENSTSTVTAAGTTTLTIDSTQTQVFTGSTTQNVNLPTTGVIAGQRYVIVNQSTGTVTVKSSGGNAICDVRSNRVGVFRAVIATPTVAADWHPSVPTTSTVASTVVQRDANSNANANAFIAGANTTATSAGTLTMTVASQPTQIFTGSTTHTVKLPTTGVIAGQQYTIINQSSGSVTVQSSGANTITTLTAGTMAIFAAYNTTPTAAGDWKTVTAA
jgi:hypothetical protein